MTPMRQKRSQAETSQRLYGTHTTAQPSTPAIRLLFRSKPSAPTSCRQHHVCSDDSHRLPSGRIASGSSFARSASWSGHRPHRSGDGLPMEDFGRQQLLLPTPIRRFQRHELLDRKHDFPFIVQTATWKAGEIEVQRRTKRHGWPAMAAMFAKRL